MKRIGVRELIQNLNQVPVRLTRGETLQITDRRRLITRLVPVGGDDSTLARLVSAGRGVAPTSTGPVPLPPQLEDQDVDVAQVLVTVRDEER